MSEPSTAVSPVTSSPVTSGPLISGPVTSSPVTSGPLITAAQLAERTASVDATPVLLDVRWSLAGSDLAGYLESHLPGAAFLDLDRDLAGTPGIGGRHPMPDPVALQRVWRAAGVDDASDVVVYDGGNGLGAARAWWLLRWSGLASVRVLDGGLPAWTADPARPLERGEPAPRRTGTMTVVPGAMPVVDADQAAALAAAPDGVLLDARAAERFRGEVEPVDPIAGHIPGSVNLPVASLLTDRGTYRSADDLATALRAAGVAASGVQGSGTGVPQAAASCGSGVTACQVVLAGEVAGVRLALYPGSYSQWLALGRPVAVGD